VNASAVTALCNVCGRLRNLDVSRGDDFSSVERMARRHCRSCGTQTEHAWLEPAWSAPHAQAVDDGRRAADAAALARFTESVGQLRDLGVPVEVCPVMSACHGLVLQILDDGRFVIIVRGNLGGAGRNYVLDRAVNVILTHERHRWRIHKATNGQPPMATLPIELGRRL